VLIASKLAIFSVSGFKDEQLIKKQTYMKTETCKLYSRDFWIFVPNIVKIDHCNSELYRFKVGAFFWDTVLLYIQIFIWILQNICGSRKSWIFDAVAEVVERQEHWWLYYTWLLNRAQIGTLVRVLYHNGDGESILPNSNIYLCDFHHQFCLCLVCFVFVSSFEIENHWLLCMRQFSWLG